MSLQRRKAFSVTDPAATNPAADPSLDSAAGLQEQKQRMRQRHSAARTRLRRDAQEKSRLDQAVVAHTAACIDFYGATGRDVAAYAPLPSEPGPPDFPARLLSHAARVWLPISLDHGQLAWSTFEEGAQVPGALGIFEPAGERRGSEVLRECALIIVPALAVDASGMRLGKGAGYYDRALSGIDGDVAIAAVVFDHEVVDSVPHNHFDAAVDAVITPSGFFVVEGTAAR